MLLRAAVLALTTVATGMAVAGATPAGAWHQREAAIMGTRIAVELWSPTEAQGEAAIDAVMAEMHRVDALMSHYKPESQLSQINAHAGAGPVRVDRELFDLIARSLDFSRLTDGAFDITYASVGYLYDYRHRVRPDEAEIDSHLPAVDWRSLELDPANSTVRFRKSGMRIDLGGFAKGHAVDTSVALLREFGIAHAIVSAGGDSRVIGDRRGRPWSVAVRDPRRADAIVAVLPLEDTSISTSGDYERYFERDGVRHHHLIDPKTGESPRALRSVTILAADGLTCEALSKSVFVMGLDKGMRWVESLPGVDAIVVDAAGALHVSSGLLDARPQHAGDTPQ